MRIAIALLLLTAGTLHAQARYLAGGSGALDLGNKSIGLFTGFERPIGSRVELDAYETYAPLEWHQGLGRGWANDVQGGGIVWLVQGSGISATLQNSSYYVNSASKDAYYLSVGSVERFQLQGIPNRIFLWYVRQMVNGTSSAGLESSQLQGISIAWDIRPACARRACLRVKESFDVAHVLEQGNPLSSVPRKGAWGGGAAFTVSAEFGGRGEF